MPAPNHYEVLGLTPGATTQDVERRYEELHRLYGSDGAHAPMMKLIQEARRVLGSPALREIYDAGLVGASQAPPFLSPAVPPVPAPPAPRTPFDVTQPVPPPPPPVAAATKQRLNAAQERTTVVAPPPADPAASLPDEKKIARELSRRGVDPDEIERLLAGNQPAPSGRAAKPLPSMPIIPPSAAYEPKPTITLPPFRESSADEKQRAERLLTGANISRRRQLFTQAEKECREALELVPKDAAALELYGDILQAVGRVDDALYSYQRATEADSARRTAEKKYAELMLLQNREIEMLRVETIPRSPLIAVLLSGVLPGTGQLYNGDTLKGILFLLIAAACITITFWTPFGLPHTQSGIPSSLIGTLVVLALLYIVAVVDANLSARRGKIRSGWDV